MISIPFFSEKSTAETRPKYLALLREAGADRVFLCLGNPYGDAKKLEAIGRHLAQNIAYYTENGYEVGVWIGGFGHGGTLAHEVPIHVDGYTRIRGLGNGGESDDSFCPMDPNYLAMYREYIRMIAEAGARMIMIDDDLRLVMHGPVELGCACPLHMEEFNRRAAEAGIDHIYTREELADELFTGSPTSLRKLWLDLMGDTMKKFAASLRAELDTIDPTVRLGHCACLSTWDTDGVDSITLSRIFAGSTRPFLRLIGAPYWNKSLAFNTTGLGSVIDLERMQFAWCQQYAPEIELMSEGDVYPRPRYKIPSSYLECFHQVLTADQRPDILKYMLDYTYDPDYETGYIRRHVHTGLLREQLCEAFKDTEPAGIYVFEEMHKLADMDCRGFSEKKLSFRLVSAAANFAGAMSIPISFNRSVYTKAAMISGENAKYAPSDLIEMPLILDCQAARILTERGYDVGLRAWEPMAKPSTECYSDGRTMPVDAMGGYYRLTPAENSEIDSCYPEGMPAMYRYIRPSGAAVLVYAFDMEGIDMTSAMIRNYCRQEQLFRMLPVSPVQIRKEPGAYVLCRKAEDRLAVGIWNFGDDILLPDRITLDRPYHELLPIGGTSAVLSGNTVTLQGEIPPYGFCGFVVK